MTVTGLLNWLVVRQDPTRRIYGAADAGLFISFATCPFAVPAEEGGGFMQLPRGNYGGFIFGLRTIRGACVIRANCSGSLRGPTYHVGYPVTWRLPVREEV
jgi:hypothetical protein